MGNKWKPSALQRRAFAERMKDPDEQQAYQDRQNARAEINYRSKFMFGLRQFVPTKEQYDFVVFNAPEIMTSEQRKACNQIAYGYNCNEKVDHKHIHIVNEMRHSLKSLK